MRKGHTNVRFGLILYPKKPLIIAHSGMSRETRCLKVVRGLLNLHTLFMGEAKALARSCVHAGSSEPSQHADVIRTIISCADQFIVFFLCGPFFHFLIQYFGIIIGIVKISKHCQSPYIWTSQSMLSKLI